MKSLLLAVLLAPVVAIAQEAPVLVGARIRLATPIPAEPRREGTVKRTGLDSAVVDLDPTRGAYGFTTRTVPYRQLLVPAGTRRRTADGAALGLLVGIVGGAGIGYAAIAEQGHYIPSVGAAAGAVVGGVFGAITGGRIGSKRTKELWRPAVP